MDILSLLFLAAALAMDAFSAAVTDGMIVKKIRFYDAIKVGLFFGVFQAQSFPEIRISSPAMHKYIMNAQAVFLSIFRKTLLSGKNILIGPFYPQMRKPAISKAYRKGSLSHEAQTSYPFITVGATSNLCFARQEGSFVTDCDYSGTPSLNHLSRGSKKHLLG